MNTRPPFGALAKTGKEDEQVRRRILQSEISKHLYVVAGHYVESRKNIMSKKVSNQREVFFKMAREFPVRTGIFTFGLPVFSLLQLVNGIVNGGSLPLIGLFASLVVVYSVQLTNYHIASYQRQKLSQRWIESE